MSHSLANAEKDDKHSGLTEKVIKAIKENASVEDVKACDVVGKALEDGALDDVKEYLAPIDPQAEEIKKVYRFCDMAVGRIDGDFFNLYGKVFALNEKLKACGLNTRPPMVSAKYLAFQIIKLDITYKDGKQGQA